ncbi:hypothetical protein AX16_007470 [Volvariella volvacea WC 439]|nr:hypothetical protein AX16_007470 [Volvariella volvacea WC 439]
MLRRITMVPGLSRGVSVLSSSRMNALPRYPDTVRQASTAPAFSSTPKVSASPSDDPSPQNEQLKVEKDQPDTPTFSTLSNTLSPETLRAITSGPFHLTHMTPVQAEVLPLLPDLANPYDPSASLTPSPTTPPRDLLVKAKTGTGKTLAFLVPAIEARARTLKLHGENAVRDAGLKHDPQLERRARRAYAKDNAGTLVISPTRELAAQIAKEAMKLTAHHDGMEVQLLVGGANKGQQLKDWKWGRKDIVIATPGRLRDLLSSVDSVAQAMKNTQLLILDEADTLLDMGFREEIDAIAEYLPPVPQRQTFLFSATVSPAIQSIARATLSSSHQFINCVSENTSPVHAHVEQNYTVLPSAAHQVPHLLRLLAHDQLTNPGASKSIVFLPTTKMTQLFASFLRELSRTCLPAGRKTQVYEIHSKRPQTARDRTSASFRSDTSGASVLVTSDVSARGVDYPGVTRVIQVGVPSGSEQYIHRVGRTGRAGTQGRGDLVLLPWERGFVDYCLGEVPLKPLTAAEMEKQLVEVAEQYEKNPEEFFKERQGEQAPTSRIAEIALAGGKRDKFGSRRQERGAFGQDRERDYTVKKFVTPLVPVLEEMPNAVASLAPKLDPEAVRETFTSLLGYYVGKTDEMRVRKADVLEGCQKWSVDACGLETPPFLSERFLKQLGLGEDGGRGGRGRGSRGRVERDRRGGGFGFKRDVEGGEDGDGFRSGRSGRGFNRGERSEGRSWEGREQRGSRDKEWMRKRREDGDGGDGGWKTRSRARKTWQKEEW